MTFGIWHGGSLCGSILPMASYLRNQHHWIFCVAALAVWFALGSPVLKVLSAGALIRGSPVSELWLLPFTIFGAAALAVMALKLRTSLRWTLLCVQVASVVAMAIITQWAMMSVFLIITAWQAAMATTPVKALSWVGVQTLVAIGALAITPNPDLCWVIAKSFGLQLLLVFTANALRRETQTAQALTRTNGELRAAQALIANTARDSERLRISRELHDAWGHELTALGLQLEIASHVTQAGRANDHVLQAKGLSRDLLAKVREAVAALRKAEHRELKVAAAGQAETSQVWRQVNSGGDDEHSIALGGGTAGQGSPRGDGPLRVARHLANQRHWIFSVAALAVWFAVGWQPLHAMATGTELRGSAVPALWLVPFMLFAAAVVGAMVLRLRTGLHWTLLCVQVAAVMAMMSVFPSGKWPIFLIVTAWQVGMAITPVKAFAWVLFQSLAVSGTLALAVPKLDSFSLLAGTIFSLDFVLQLFIVLTAQALRREGETARALAQTNRELRAAQAIIANTVRDAERLRISRELHDAWGHELTALGLQLEIASHVTEPGRANDHVMQAKGLARTLLGKVRDVVAALREAERCDLKEALERLAQSVPTPAVHLEISPDVRVSPEQAHALMRCAQEAVTNAVRHAEASNLWLRVTGDGEGIRLVARNDGSARPGASAPGSGLLGMRERVEHLGGKLAVRTGGDFGFTVDAWLPSRTPQAA